MAEHIAFAMANISSSLQRTYRVAARQHIDLAEVWGLWLLIREKGFEVWLSFLTMRGDSAVKVPF